MMKRIPPMTIICSLCILSSLSAATDQSNLQSRVQLAYDNAMPGDVFKQLSEGLKCRLSMGNVTQPITLFGNKITYQTALDAICEDAACRWRIEDGNLFVEAVSSAERPELALRSRPVKNGLDNRLDSSMVFNSEPLQEALRKVFGSAKAGYILFGEMMSRERFVTADVRNQTLKEALVRILENAGLRDFEIMETLENPASYFIRVRSRR